MDTPRIPVILLITRDPQLAYLIQRYAGNCGCQLLHAEHRANVMNTMAGNPPDVILLDVSQANAEGQLLWRELKSDTGAKSIPMIVCATNEMDLLESEAEGRLLQPILFGDFVNAIAETGIQIPKSAKEV